MGTELEVLVDGWSKLSTAGFVVDALPAHWFGEGQSSRYIALLRLGSGPSLSYSLRFYLDAPTDEGNLLVASVAEVVKKTPRDSSARLTGVIALEPHTQFQLVKNALWITTNERTVVLMDDKKHEALVARLFEYLTQAQFDLQDVVGGAHISSAAMEGMAMRLSKRLSGRLNPSFKARIGGGKRSSMRRQSGKAPKVAGELTSLMQVLQSTKWRNEFREYLKFSFAEENLDFWEAVERFEGIPNNRMDERRKAFAKIMERFVVEHSQEQVNLPSHQSRQLLDIYEDMKDEAADAVIDANVFESAKREIFDLIYRNFFSTFVAAQQQKALRQQQAAEMKGSFAAIWNHAGLEGYNHIVDGFQPHIQDLEQLKGFFSGLQDQTLAQLQALRALIEQFPAMHGSHGEIPPERTLGRIVYKLNSGLSRKMTILMEFNHDVDNFALKPIQELRETVANSLKNIQDGAKAAIKDMLDSRAQLRDAMRKEAEVFRTNKPTVDDFEKNPKPTKKQTSAAEKAKREIQSAQDHREALELNVSQIETAHTEKMLVAFDSLESLELHRLDTLREILTQYTLAERSAQSKIEIGVNTVLAECFEMDSIQELVDLAKNASSGGNQKRPQSIRKAMVLNLPA